MTKPISDAFAVSEDMLTPDQAIAALLGEARTVMETEVVPITKALGRRLAQDVISDRTSPPHDNSAVDGFAIAHSVLAVEGTVTVPISLRIPAGASPDQDLAPGTAARIFTGAPVPRGADTVIPQEVCVHDEANQCVTLPSVKKAGANVRYAGEDVRIGDVVITKGTKLRAQEIGLAASLGCGALTVYRPVRVAVFSTGDEVRDPGGAAPAGCIYDANRYSLMALLQSLGCEPVDFGILPDRFEAVQDALAKAAPTCDAILTSGGISTGDEDHVKAAVESQGKLGFWRVAIRPGRPLAFGRVGQTPFFGLPGNPIASMVCFMMFARPFLLRIAGQQDVTPQRIALPAAFDQKKRPGRREWLRGWIETDGQGRQIVQKFHTAGSGVLTSMTASQGLIELHEDLANIEAGMTVQFLPFPELLG